MSWQGRVQTEKRSWWRVASVHLCGGYTLCTSIFLPSLTTDLSKSRGSCNNLLSGSGSSDDGIVPIHAICCAYDTGVDWSLMAFTFLCSSLFFLLHDYYYAHLPHNGTKSAVCLFKGKLNSYHKGLSAFFFFFFFYTKVFKSLAVLFHVSLFLFLFMLMCWWCHGAFVSIDSWKQELVWEKRWNVHVPQRGICL